MNSATPRSFAANSEPVRIPPPAVIFGRSSIMSRLREVVDPISLVPIPVFIHGATGTGKEVLAQYIHQRSPWRQGPFLKVSCAAIPGTLLEAELFGFEKGAFTGAYSLKPGLIELSESGTLLLDDICELDLGLQAKLLQFLQDGTFTRIGGQEERRITSRIICISSRSLEAEVEQGLFREDLFHRISGASIAMPQLRQRIEDLPAIAQHLLYQFGETFHIRIQPLPPAVNRRLLRYHWPGNIRELENVLRRYALLGTPTAILDGLTLSSCSTVVAWQHHTPTDPSLKARTRHLVRQAEALAILQVLQEHDWNRTKSAQSLNISLRALLYKMRSAGISGRDPYKPDNEIASWDPPCGEWQA